MNHFQLNEINLTQLPSGTIFKIGFLCNLGLWGVFGLLVGGMALAGFETVHWNGTYVTGFSGLIVGLMISAIFAVLGAVLLFLGGLIIGLIARRFNFGKLQYMTGPTTNSAEEVSNKS